MQQMLVRYSIADYSGFKTAFDADAEDRANNSLGLLQLWREGGNAAWALFSVRDAEQARAYLSGAATVFNTQAGVSQTEVYLLETA